MIFKEMDEVLQPLSKAEQNGVNAEKQMAFFLRRFFKDSTQVDVLNSLRIELEGEIAQIDHLVLLPHGLLIVESKSVVGKVQIKDDGQWVRWYDNQSKGMRSPIVQAQMQGMLLKDLLSAKVKQKGVFDAIPVNVLVAISDDGVILWPKSGVLPEVCKADQVPGKIEQLLARHAQSAQPLTVEKRQKISKFLCAMHQPRVPSPITATQTVPPTPVKAATPVVDQSEKLVAVCKHCQSRNVQVNYGHSYYLQCLSCQQNTSLKLPMCGKCGGKMRLRKQGKQYFLECPVCPSSELFFTNP